MLKSVRRFEIKRFVYVLALTMIASAAVLVGFGLYHSGGLPGPLIVFWQSLATALLVAVGAAWTSSHHFEPRQPTHGQGDPTSEHIVAAEFDKKPTAVSLEEQGITVKLLELIALGDRYGNAFSVALLRVDHLKDIEANYDTSVTMRVLREVCHGIAYTLRMPDRVGEYDYGAYLVVLPETNLPGAIQIAERLRAAVSDLEIMVSKRVVLQVTVSAGVTCYRRGDDLRSLLDRAGVALREAENQGRNRVLPDLAA